MEPRSPRFAAQALERAVTGLLRGVAIRVLCPEDFLLFKLLSTRARDVADAATVWQAADLPLDRVLIETEARRLAEDIPDHDITRRLAQVRELG